MTLDVTSRKNIIIFGASKAGESTYKTLNNLKYNIRYFVDNDSTKWGRIFCGKTIYNPNVLFEMDSGTDFIIIGSMYIEEISKQLNEMGLGGLYEDAHVFIFKIVKEEISFFIPDDQELELDASNDKKRYLISLPSGLVLGGLEVWAMNTYRMLIDKGKETYLINLSDGVKTKLITLKDDNCNLINISYDQYNFYERLSYIVKNIIKFSPSVVVPHFSEEVFYACYILKQYYNKKIKVVSILHGDVNFIYSQNIRHESIIDKFICVSDDIREKLVKILNNREKDIYTLITPVRSEKHYRAYSKRNKHIKLGYVGRLVRPDKRADLLIKLIKILEDRDIKYQFDIAGEGEYYENLKNYIEINMIQDRVNLLGGIPNHLIYEFWRDKDIFINVSDTEGTSISMLEGLYNGAVPVLTDVSGVRKFITHGENGFIVNTGDIDSMVDYIEHLDQNRDLLKSFGKSIHYKVSEICNPDKFIEEFIKICEEY